MDSVTKIFASERGGKRTPGLGKKLGRPRGKKTKVIRLPADIADKIKKNMDAVDAIFSDKQNEAGSCHKESENLRSGRRKKRTPVPGKKVGRPRGEKTKVIRLSAELADKIKENTDIIRVILYDRQNESDCCNKKLKDLSEVIEKWNGIISGSDNPNHPDLNKAKEMLTELNEALKKG